MDLSKSSENTISKMSNIYQNNLSYTTIRGLSMVSLVIDGKERVCLSQISNSLLKKFTYNEIHNRRVALGINCIQCTPLQLDILRSTGAMPVSSRRCGMITKREAERLVKSFLDDNKPLTLPDNFAFDVQHKCGFGCRGIFFPSRYNSSRAKCIRCYYCFAFFSPNKFIFHMHETSNSKYVKPETANFNSWRRHISLINESGNDELSSAWEDVKSIFNGGKRKRNQHSPVSSQYCDDSDLDCSLNDSSTDLIKLNSKDSVGKSGTSHEKMNDDVEEFDECEEEDNNNNNKHVNETQNNNNFINKFDLNEQILKLPFLNPFFTASAAFNFTQLLPELFGLSNNSLLIGQNMNRTDQKFLQNPLMGSSSLDINNNKQARFDYANICSSLFGNLSEQHNLNKQKLDTNEQFEEDEDEDKIDDEEVMNNDEEEEDDEISTNDSKLQSSAFKPPEKNQSKATKSFFSLVDHI